MKWRLACLDMAGTTVRDDGLVEQAFAVSIAGENLLPGTAAYERALTIVRKTMGQSKIDVFRLLLGDVERANAANALFEEAYADLVADGLVKPIPGASDAITVLRDAGVKVALMTGFARPTQDAILDALGWREIADIALCPSDVGRGRPHPDLVLAAAVRLGVEDLETVAVVGDSPADVIAGLRAKAGIVVGVLTGPADRPTLLNAGATTVIGSIGELPGLLLDSPTVSMSHRRAV
jgi:phosphonatase-like hydrolase